STGPDAGYSPHARIQDHPEKPSLTSILRTNLLEGVGLKLRALLCGAALTFFAAAKKVSKESGSHR
ncbi:hypothetical protein NE850_35905, partial [Paraburkholderia sp. USG1]|uniref:hypothetical protein n=1 Tax=Paraburkholderia sp. USG1 TaxID=2952268 RepID=UPI0028610DC5